MTTAYVLVALVAGGSYCRWPEFCELRMTEEESLNCQDRG